MNKNIIFVFFLLCDFIFCEKNTTCVDGRFCFTYIKVEDHCEILTGKDCHPPCDIENCEIYVENNVDCEHYLCAPPPPSVATKTFFIGFGGSVTSTILLFLGFKGAKKIMARRRRRNAPQNEEANITGRENEGNAATRPIYNPGQTSQAAASQPSTSRGTSGATRMSSSLPTTPTKERKKEVPCCEKDVTLKKDPLSKRLRSSVKRVSWKSDEGKKSKVFV